MSTISNLIFHNAKHYMSSPFGKRTAFKTSAGTTSSFHSGTDYATYGVKLPQYAIADGTILSCGKASDGANWVWVQYPQYEVKMLHYHLDSISVKAGQKVTKDTVIGATGKTGKATGIHLHLGIKKINGTSWIDPELWSANEYPKYVTTTTKTVSTYTTGTYTVATKLLRVRKGAGTKYDQKKFTKLSSNAQEQILKLNSKAVDGYVSGMTINVTKITEADGYHWGKTPSGWVALEYCKKG